MKNDDFLRDAKVIIDKLSVIEGLNKSSQAILNVAAAFYEDNEGRFSFHKAQIADFMHYFCTEMKFASDNDLRRIMDDPTSNLEARKAK